MHVLHGARTPAELVREDMFATGGGLSAHLRCAAESGADGEVVAGTVNELLDDTLLGLDDSTYYLCGPPPMVAAMEARLGGARIPAARIFSERFNPA